MRKWYHDEEIPVDEEYFTSDESANEMDASKSRSLQRSHRRASNEQLMRTLFIGNLPPNITKKRIEKLFNNVLKNDKVVSSNCRVESVRFRGAIPITGGTSKLARKRAAIKGEFSGVSTFRMGYVVLTSKVGVQVALSLNGYCLNSDGFIINPEESNKLIDSDTVNSVNNNCIYHIRVDRVTENKTKQKLDDCVFLGNLPFDCTEEEIHNVLSSLGTLSNVRLVRDSQTGAVRGFGYATFTDPSIIPLAIRASNTLSVRGRQIRICEWKMKKSKKNNKNKHFYQLNSTDKKMINTHPKKNMKNKSGKKRTDKKKQGKSLMKNKTKK
ncbi:unnamed protein product [Heterobilharzia americana]|nr:unnamed protein product [Heterobilharzia americana]